MQCVRCGRELRIVPEQVGIDQAGMPVYHRFGYCDACCIRWDLDVQPANNVYVQGQGTVPKRESICGILGLIFGFFPSFCFVGIILSIIGLCKKNSKKVCASIGLAVSIIVSLFWLILLGGQYQKYVERARENAGYEACMETEPLLVCEGNILQSVELKWK